MMPENPYPEDVFPPYTSQHLNRIDRILASEGYSFTRLNGSWGRHVWDYATKDARRELARKTITAAEKRPELDPELRLFAILEAMREIAEEGE